MRNRGPWLVFCCYVMFGIFPIYWKLLVNLQPYFILSNRVVWSLIFAVVLLFFNHHLEQLKALVHNCQMMKMMTISGILLVINWGSYIVAVNTGHVIDASLAYFMSPIMSILIGRFFFKESLSGLQKLSVIVATGGVLYAVISYHVVPWLALIIGGSFAFYGAVKKTFRVDGLTSLAGETLTMLIPACIVIAYLCLKGQVATSMEHPMLWWQWLMLPTTGIITGWPLVLFAQGIRTTSYSLSGILMYINPTLQLFCGIYIFGEHFNRIHGIMFGIIWIAVLMYMISSYQNLRKYRQSERKKLS